MATRSNYALRLPASLKQDVEKAARDDGTTLNQFIVVAVAEKLAKLQAIDFFAARRGRADIAAALKFLRREGGEPPREGDELPVGWKRENARAG